MSVKYCIHCEQGVTPRRKFSKGWCFLGLLIWVVPGLLYLMYCFLIRNETCPMCDSNDWGSKPKKR